MTSFADEADNPETIVSDNGTELTSKRHPHLGGRDRCQLALHRPGKVSMR